MADLSAARARAPSSLGPDDVGRALGRGCKALLDLQHAEGYWEGEIESDPGVTASYLLLARYVNRPDPAVEREMVAYLTHTQLPGGGWAAYPGGPASLDVTLLCYAALRDAGWPADAPALAGARTVITAHGGIDAVGFIPRMQLVFAGAVPLAGLTYLSPKIAALPRWVHPNLYDLGILRQALLPVLLLQKWRAVTPRPPGGGLEELGAGSGVRRPAMTAGGRAASLVSRLLDRAWPARGLDRRALEWLVERRNADGLWLGALHVTVRCLMALHAWGDPRYAPLIDEGLAGLRRLQVRDALGRRQRISRSPLLDTAYVAAALLDAGLPPDHPRLRRAYRWLLDRQAAAEGDWRQTARGPTGGARGWAFVPENARSPDTDTTALVLSVLARAPGTLPGREEAIAAGRRWLLSVQNANGSWAVWEQSDRRAMAVVKELELNSAVDVGTPDVTGRITRIMTDTAARLGHMDPDVAAAAASARRYLRATQRPDASWPGRWAVNYTHGTAQAVWALAPGGEADRSAARRGVRWLVDLQQPDGGWGESPESFRERRIVAAPSTVAQTAMILMALADAPGLLDGPDRRWAQAGAGNAAAAFLVDRQRESGRWEEDAYCQAILPGHWYYRNSLLPTFAALMALARWRDAAPQANG